MDIPRPEYPRPQFLREDWLCLNGEWAFEIDAGDSGLDRGLRDRPLRARIIVPFCPESRLSGVEHTDFMNAVWYQRTVRIPEAWAGRGVLLHFQAVDYDATVWANGVEVGRHRGGFSPFTCDLSGVARPGEDVALVVRARDPNGVPQPRGKQSPRYGNFGCLYTRTTGIWQTVWLEPVPECALKRPRITPDLANSLIRLEQPLSANRPGLRLRAALRDAGGVVCQAECRADLDLTPRLDLPIPAERRRLWGPGDPHLYDLEITLVDAGDGRPETEGRRPGRSPVSGPRSSDVAGAVVDRATSYAGLRSVAIDGPAVKINGEVVFQRLVLDQGYDPDGILTAPTDEALVRDIELSQAAGFNGARLHQKVFEERFLYHADRIGYLLWGEFADWGCGGFGAGEDHQRPGATYITQWLEVIERDYSHPSLVGWCPLNETHQAITDRVTALDDVMRGMFLAAKALDTSRPVLDTSGYSHRVREADVYDCHDYEQNPERFQANQAGLAEGKPFTNSPAERPWSVPYRGQPFFVSEFGGIWWNPDAKPGEDSWGYGERPKTLEEFYHRFERLCGILLDDPRMFGYCYTQLTDVYQEQNGIYTFDRRAKFDVERIRRAQQRPAAIEET